MSLEFKDVSYTYHTLSGETAAVDKLTFSVKEGEFVSVIGPSGCGKSTILSLAAGLIQPSRGKIERGGGEFGYMLQTDALFPWRTVEQHLTDVLPKSRRGEAGRWLALAGLEAEKTALPAALSGGMKRRLALVRALALGGKLYLLDEPFTGVDGDRIKALIAALKELDTPVVLSSHEWLVRSLADQVINLDGPPLRRLPSP